MIEILRKEDCVGCNACVQRCPKSCISMHEDEQGFMYPKVDLGLCINCHLCEKVCPVTNQAEPQKPLQTYAAKNRDAEVKRNSSSGGIFYALAETIISEGGVVFGAKFNDDWEVVHAYAETLEGIKAFQGSKYVQSRIGETFTQAEQFLKAGRRVMFTGTPCQIAGLKHFLRKDYGSQLLTVDVVCHGVPSPLVWREYLKYITRPKGASAGKNTDFESTLKDIEIRDISRISFRDKRISWEKYGFSVHTVARQGDRNSDFQSTKSQSEEQELLFEILDKNLFMQGFLKDLYLRPSCYECPAKCGKSQSDITLADFWGISAMQPQDYDSTGVSLVLANTTAGLGILQKLDGRSLQITPSSYETALRCNPSIEHPVHRTRWVDEFWSLYPQQGLPVIAPLARKAGPSLPRRILSRCKRIACQILGKRIYSVLKNSLRL